MNAKFFLKRGHDFSVIQELEIIGAGKRNVDCLKCGSSDRDRLVVAFFEKEFQKSDLANKQLLHIAPEKALSDYFQNKCNMMVTAADAKIGYAKYLYGSKVIKADLCQLPFQPNTFDFVIANHVLEHVPDAQKAISEIERVLKPNGFAITQVPLSKKLKNTIESLPNWGLKEKKNQLGQADHLRLFGNDFESLLEQSGLQPDFWHHPISADMKHLGLNPNEALLKSIKL
jgi:SAM-dependent methyltransferase